MVTGDPAGVRTVLSADPDIYQALGADLLAPVLGKNNLILLSGEQHRAMGKVQSPQFHGERLRAYGELITRIAASDPNVFSSGSTAPSSTCRSGAVRATAWARLSRCMK